MRSCTVVSVTTLDNLPGPRTPRLYNSIEFAFALRRAVERDRERFGHAYRVRGVQGDLVLTTSPEHARRVFAADSAAFDQFSLSLRGVLGPTSVLITSGAPHKQRRKLLTPPINGARLRAFGQDMQRLADAHIATLTPGRSFRALSLTTDYTLDVIAHTVFGAASDQEARTLKTLLSSLLHAVPPLALFVPTLQRSWFPPWRRFLAAQRRFDAWVHEKIALRRQHQEAGSDVLSLLVAARGDDGTAMGDPEIRDQLVTLLLAGHETTSIALASAMSRLAQHPEVLAKLRAELAGAGADDDVQRLPYLSAVVDETLRIDPIVSDIARVPTSPFALDDELTVTPSQVLVVLMEGIHRDPALYPEPAAFRPERFLERKFSPHEYAPFGGGVRRCLGAAFSDYETKIFLAALVRKTSLSLTRGAPDPRVRRNVTMGPKYGVPMRVDAVH